MDRQHSHIAVVGGGQLARMMQPAAIALGIRLRLLAEGPDVSAAQVIPDHIVGDYRDLDDLRRVAEGCAVVTFDHEHVPPEHLRMLQAEGHVPRPGPDALLFAQDKALMRARLSELGPVAADDIAGIIVVNGWRNVIYLASGLLALAFAPRHARRTAAALAGFYLVYGIWGLIGTDHDIGNILEVLPLTDEDNVLHLVIGGLGAIAALADRPLPSLPRRKPKPKRRRASSRSRA